MNTIVSGRYSLPGGGVEVGEPLEVALKREVWEETKLTIEVGRLAGFREQFFYYDPSDKAFHSFQFYYVCRPLTFELANKDEIEDDVVDKPQWVKVSSLTPANFHDQGELIVEILHSRDNSSILT